ncbi:MAG: nucleotidyltransferase family protein [Selenomonadaceae bacterium]|nr:nucleotidyltransferase family protein [Selenomonadaceae bacterium]
MAVGIIAEFNPFHDGHAYQIGEIRRKIPCEEIVAVMSGSFTQRGTPAILDKWTRAKLAVTGGVDLVLELPFTSAVRSAQDFATGGVRLLSALGIVDTLAFGAETSDLQGLKSAAAAFEEKSFQRKLRAEISSGLSYAAAVSKILLPVDMRQPNTILAVEYLRALPESVEPLLIPRGEVQSSATAIRAALYQNPALWEKISVPPFVLDALKSAELVREEFLLRPVLAKLLTSSAADLREIYGMAEGIEFRLAESARTARTFDELVLGVVNRRFPISRVKRLLLHFLLNFKKPVLADYVRVLAFNERGQALLKKIRAASSLPVVTKVSQHITSKEILCAENLEPYKKNLAFDLRATDLRETLYDVPQSARRDFLISPRCQR